MPKKREPDALAAWMAKGRRQRDQLLRERGPLPAQEPSVNFPLPGLSETPFMAFGRFVLRDGRPVMRELHIVPDPQEGYDIPARGLTVSKLRNLHSPSGFSSDVIAAIFDKAGVQIVTGGRARPRRKAYYSYDDVAAFARDYIALSQRAEPNPRAALAAEYGKDQHVSANYVPEMIRRAVDRGYLTPAKRPGDRAPRQATPKLLEWIAENEPPQKRRKR